MKPPAPLVPLFPVSLAFASGCILALSINPSASIAVSSFAILSLVWLTILLKNHFHHHRLNLLCFFSLVASGGCLHTTLITHFIPGDDVRSLPPYVRLDSLTTWLAVVQDEPIDSAPRNARFSLPHQSFTLALQAWHLGSLGSFRRLGAALQAVPDWHTVSGLLACRIVQPSPPVHIGDQLLLTGDLQSIPPPLSPGETDNRAILARAGIYFRIESAEPVRLVATNQLTFWRRFSFAARDWVYHQLHLGIEDDPETADTLTGMLIGYRQNLPLQVEDDFRRTGTLHVFAVSGQNVSEIAELSIVLLSFLLVPWRWAWLLAPFLITFCLLTGSQASAMRATVMGLLILLAWWLGRPVQAKALWSLAFLLMLIWDPTTLLDPGTQLSFGVVWGLIALSTWLARPFEKQFRPDSFIPTRLVPKAQRYESIFWRFWVVRTVAASVAATVVSEPIAGLVFHQITPVSVLANLVVVPCAGVITAVGTLSVAISAVPLCQTLTAWLNNANWIFAKILVFFVHFLAHEPGSAFNVCDLQAIREPPPAITIFPIQSGAACLLRLPNGSAWLFNTGRDTDARYTTARVCQYYGINRLAGLALLQVNTEANGGESFIEQTLAPDRLALPILRARGHIQKVVDESSASRPPVSPAESWQAGDRIEFALHVEAEVLWPEAPLDHQLPEFTHAQDRALVLRFLVGHTSFLWAGECRTAVRERLLMLHPGLQADVVILSTGQTPSQAEADWVRQLHATAWLHFHQDNFVLNPVPREILQQNNRLYWPLESQGAVTFTFSHAGTVQRWSLPIYPSP